MRREGRVVFAASTMGACFSLFDEHVAGFWLLQHRPKTYNDMGEEISVIMRSQLALRDNI